MMDCPHGISNDLSPVFMKPWHAMAHQALKHHCEQVDRKKHRQDVFHVLWVCLKIGNGKKIDGFPLCNGWHQAFCVGAEIAAKDGRSKEKGGGDMWRSCVLKF